MILIKTPEQINGIRKSCKLAAKTLRYIKPYVRPGATTSEINDLAAAFITKHGAISAPLNYPGHNGHLFPKETCISVNEVICHGIPGEYILKEGDIVNVDVTTILGGYYGDTSVTFPVGKISEDAEHLLKTTKKCLEIGIGQVFPGNRFGNIGYAIGMYAHIQGTTIVTAFTAHGVGIHFHEPPTILHIAAKNSGAVMQPGMVFTVEPMLCLGTPDAVIDEQDHWTARTADGMLSAQFEHQVLVTDSGVEVLTDD